MLNPFFLQGSKGEQDLVQDLINEQLRMYGIEVYYIPREYITEKSVIKEVIQSEFTSAYPIEAYLDTYDGYGGQGTILSKFGIEDVDDVTLIISRERYETYISPLIRDIPNIKLSSRPKEGDLIYFPLGDRIFEIKYVEHEKPFYQLKKTYVYELRCELFRFQDEVIDTALDFIDDNTSDIGYIQTLQMVGAATTASASATIRNGAVRLVTITNRGRGYSSAPRVAFSSAPIGGLTAVGVATMIGNIVDFCNVGDSDSLRVQGVNIVNSGYGYTVAPSIAFFGDGVGTAATTYIGDGVVGLINVTNGGGGYATPPTVTIDAPTGVGVTIRATAISAINTASVVTAIYITNGGLGYDSTPTVTISSPISDSGSGSYQYNEIVTGSTSGVTARVKSWNIVTNVLEVSNLTGSFAPGETIVGSASSASYDLRVPYSDNLADAGDSHNKYGKYEDNFNIETEADQIIDFSEKNPFGTP